MNSQQKEDFERRPGPARRATAGPLAPAIFAGRSATPKSRSRRRLRVPRATQANGQIHRGRKRFPESAGSRLSPNIPAPADTTGWIRPGEPVRNRRLAGATGRRLWRDSWLGMRLDTEVLKLRNRQPALAHREVQRIRRAVGRAVVHLENFTVCGG